MLEIPREECNTSALTAVLRLMLIEIMSIRVVSSVDTIKFEMCIKILYNSSVDIVHCTDFVSIKRS